MSAGNWTASSSGVWGRSAIVAGLTANRRSSHQQAPRRGRFQIFLRKCSGTIPALAADFDDRAAGGEAGALCRLADAAGDAVVVDMRRLPAIVADQEDAVVQAARVLVGDIGVGAFHAHRQV